jgi:hypothetical protein
MSLDARLHHPRSPLQDRTQHALTISRSAPVLLGAPRGRVAPVEVGSTKALSIDVVVGKRPVSGNPTVGDLRQRPPSAASSIIGVVTRKATIRIAKVQLLHRRRAGADQTAAGNNSKARSRLLAVCKGPVREEVDEWRSRT